MAKENQQLVEGLQSVSEQQQEPFVHIKTDEQAIEQRKVFDNARKGVFLLKKAYGRSYDLKLGTEALVMILANDGSLSYVEAIQMVGRGCRSQGQGKGVLYLVGDPYIKRDAWELL